MRLEGRRDCEGGRKIDRGGGRRAAALLSAAFSCAGRCLVRIIVFPKHFAFFPLLLFSPPVTMIPGILCRGL